MRLDFSDEINHREGKKRETRNLKIALGVATLILLPTIGSTLAATVTIGTSNTLEFAQGITATTACDSSIKLQPVSSLNGSGVFIISGIELSTLNNASNGGCAGKFFTLKVVNSSAGLVNITNGASGAATQVKFQMPSTCAVAAIVDTPDTNATVATISCDVETGSVTVTFATSVLATSLDKLTLESASS
jgi:hypothetical protein